mmetsp:Transcript_114753/g.244882  ORF Transcript_114753/g.244882 Transcript_114753/m.244882 type:complete len:242 (-) Transcript_114753:470-1195(-)
MSQQAQQETLLPKGLEHRRGPSGHCPVRAVCRARSSQCAGTRRSGTAAARAACDPVALLHRGAVGLQGRLRWMVLRNPRRQCGGAMPWKALHLLSAPVICDWQLVALGDPPAHQSRPSPRRCHARLALISQPARPNAAGEAPQRVPILRARIPPSHGTSNFFRTLAVNIARHRLRVCVCLSSWKLCATPATTATASSPAPSRGPRGATLALAPGPLRGVGIPHVPLPWLRLQHRRRELPGR